MALHQRIQFGFGGRMTPMVRQLLIINGVVFFLQLITHAFGDQAPLERWFALQPIQAVYGFRVWQFITYAFLHGGFFHLFFNMFALWMFGPEVERVMGAKPFIKYYIITAVAAGALQVLSHWNSPIIVLGASGAIYAVLTAFALFFPNREIFLLLFFILPIRIKAKYLVMIFVGFSLLSGMQLHLFASSDGIAHMAHLGGALAGFFYLRSGWLIGTLAREHRVRQWQRRQRVEQQKHQEMVDIREKVDSILDRINQVGYDNISKEDKLFLKKASEYLSKE
ncbi:rhomboid family intramembrane serine protease [candidate division KSB1 bacterium]|nr:rhomboid family intramembrane serine protease [candidate division KSB1 bacterium]